MLRDMIREESPLRRLPLALPPSQLVFVDGLRLSLESAALAYHRLHEGLLAITVASTKGAHEHNTLIAAGVDAWCVVDSLRRFRRLLQHTPGVKQNAPGCQQFYRSTGALETLRDSAQHLEDRASQALEAELPFWGTIAWTAVVDADQNLVAQMMIVLGALRTGLHPLPKTLGRPIRGEVDHVVLRAFEEEANLSDALRLADHVGAELERRLAEEMGDATDRFSSDLVVRVDLKGVDEPAPEQASINEPAG